MRWQARVSTSMMASRTAPVKARCRPIVSSSNLGHRIPGVSSSSRPWSTVIHCLPRVTPGRSPALADFFLATLLMKVDLPTLGMPTTMARTGRPTWPFSFHRAICSFSASAHDGGELLHALPRCGRPHSSTAMALAAEVGQPTACCRAGSAWSARLRMITRGLLPHHSRRCPGSGWKWGCGHR